MWGERFQWVPVCPHPTPLHIYLPFPTASPCAQWHCQTHLQMHSCGVTKLVAVESQRPLFSDPVQELDELLKILCKLWLPRALSLSSSLFQALFFSLFSQWCKVQSLDWILHSIIMMMVRILWALTEIPLNSGSGVLLFRCWYFLVRCPNVRFSTLSVFHGPDGASAHSSRLLWTYCPENVIFRYCYLPQAQDFLCFSPSHRGLMKVSS